jgi:chemotaxis regulatin CheY-phosphate phosphatase CheZ
MKMDNLETLAPQMAAGASPEVFHQLGLITPQLHDTLNKLGVMTKLQSDAEGMHDPRSRQRSGRERQDESEKDRNRQITAQHRRGDRRRMPRA